MMKLLIFVCCVVIGLVAARPADNALDKATENDVAVNTVLAAQRNEGQGNKEGSAVNITGLTTGLDPLTRSGFGYGGYGGGYGGGYQQYPPPRSGGGFSRFIDDIFQIPISVLTSVAKLITNPFTQRSKTPEHA